MNSHWASQSPVTEPGAAAAAIDALPDELASLREACSQLVSHYRAGGDFDPNGGPPRQADVSRALAT